MKLKSMIKAGINVVVLSCVIAYLLSQVAVVSTTPPPFSYMMILFTVAFLVIIGLFLSGILLIVRHYEKR